MKLTQPRIKATYRGVVLGWFDTLEDAQAAIAEAQAQESNDDAAFLAWRIR